MNGPRIGSWCSGYRGLDMAVEAVFGGTTAWVSDIDPGANKILAHHWPTTPNLGDLTTTDWQRVVDEQGPVDIVCGGYPCQPFSSAGLRKGTEDERHIWPYIADALGVLRPRVAIFENVAGHLRLGFDTVLADLARLGFDVEWACVRASEVGAPHQRSRLFIVATAADAPDLGHERRRDTRRRGHGSADHGRLAPDAGHGDEPERAWPSRREEGQRSSVRGITGRRSGVTDCPAPDTDGQGSQVREVEPDGPERPAAERSGGEPADNWGRFAPAVARWTAVTGRRAPWATDDRNRLSPAFVEWLMGLPAGHVTDVPGLTRTQQLKALGNGVVPQQAEAAIRLLAARAGIPMPATEPATPAACPAA